ncbi:MAG: type II secretion system protein [Desulfitobacteriia bacterium]
MRSQEQNLEKGKGGFTLWEVLLVLALLGFIAFLAQPSFKKTIQQVEREAKESARLQVEEAIRLYTLDVGTAPGSFRDLIIKPQDRENWRGPYLEPHFFTDYEAVYEF